MPTLSLSLFILSGFLQDISMYSMYSLLHGGFKVDFLDDSSGLYKEMFLESKVFYNLASEILKQSNVSCAVFTHSKPQFVEKVVYQGCENWGAEIT